MKMFRKCVFILAIITLFGLALQHDAYAVPGSFNIYMVDGDGSFTLQPGTPSTGEAGYWEVRADYLSGSGSGSVSANFQAIPEPMSIVLFLLGIGGLTAATTKKKKQQQCPEIKA